MNTLTSTLIDRFVEPGDDGWVIPIANGRFTVTSDYNIYDTVTQILHVRAEGISLDSVTMHVPNLTLSPTNVVYLWALAVKPIAGLTDAQMQSNAGFLPKFLNDGLSKETLDPSDVFWIAPAAGVANTDALLMLPGLSDYAVDPVTGVLTNADGSEPIIAGTGRGNSVRLIDDVGTHIEVEMGNLVRLAHGSMTEADIEATITYEDYNSDNLTFVNISIADLVDYTASETIVDTNDDYVLGNEG